MLWMVKIIDDMGETRFAFQLAVYVDLKIRASSKPSFVVYNDDFNDG